MSAIAISSSSAIPDKRTSSLSNALHIITLGTQGVSYHSFIMYIHEGMYVSIATRVAVFKSNLVPEMLSFPALQHDGLQLV